MSGFDILALDKDFNIITPLAFTLLQWNRKYFESGTFSAELPTSVYDSRIKYIYTKNRPEMGIVEQTNYYLREGYQSVNISGYFLEGEMNKRVAYQKPTKTNITGGPSWTIRTGPAEDVATDFFSGFKTVNYKYKNVNYSADLGVEVAASQHRGHTSEHIRGNEELGNKIYTILKPSLMSPRIVYDFDSSQKRFECWQGVDRRHGNTSGNNPIIFSTAYGNIKDIDLLIDSTKYKNSYMMLNSNEGQYENVFLYAANERLPGEGNSDDAFILVKSQENALDYSSGDPFINAMYAEGHEKILDYQKVVSLDFDTIQSAYEYRKDFDLGDICSIEIPELELSVDAVLSDVYEVVKEGAWNMSMEFTQI